MSVFKQKLEQPNDGSGGNFPSVDSVQPNPINQWKARIDEIGDEVEYYGSLGEKNAAELIKLKRSLFAQEKTRQSNVAAEVDSAFKTGKTQAGVVEDVLKTKLPSQSMIQLETNIARLTDMEFSIKRKINKLESEESGLLKKIRKHLLGMEFDAMVKAYKDLLNGYALSGLALEKMKECVLKLQQLDTHWMSHTAEEKHPLAIKDRFQLHFFGQFKASALEHTSLATLLLSPLRASLISLL